MIDSAGIGTTGPGHRARLHKTRSIYGTYVNGGVEVCFRHSRFAGLPWMPRTCSRRKLTELASVMSAIGMTCGAVDRRAQWRWFATARRLTRRRPRRPSKLRSLWNRWQAVAPTLPIFDAISLKRLSNQIARNVIPARRRRRARSSASSGSIRKCRLSRSRATGTRSNLRARPVISAAITGRYCAAAAAEPGFISRIHQTVEPLVSPATASNNL